MPGSKSWLKAVYSFEDGVVVHCRVVCVFVTQSFPTFCDPWIIACQAPLSMEFSRQEYWSSCHSLLLGIFLTQGSNLSLLYYRQILYSLSHQGSPVGGLARPYFFWNTQCQYLLVFFFFFFNWSDFPQEISSHLLESVCLTAKILGPKQGKKIGEGLGLSI